MTFSDWIKSSWSHIDTHGPLRGGRIAAQEFGVGIGRRLGKRVNYGKPYWGRDWDVLVLLDACRHDLTQEVAPAWDFLPDTIPATYSPASMSEEWLDHHVKPEFKEEIQETALISANAFTRQDFVQNADWGVLDEVWNHSWSHDEGTVLPRPVTDRAIQTWRDGETERMIVWYIQPHSPFIKHDWSEGFEKNEIGEGKGVHKSVWNRYRDGELSREQLWGAYRDNLNYALEDVELLLENLDAENVVISSDHANCLGEWGVYGHPPYVPAPSLKRVPWIEVDATDEQTHTPTSTPTDSTVSESDVDDRLAALGYV